MISIWRSSAVIFFIAVAVNYAWELLQAPLYEWPGKSRNALWHCFVASLGDGLLVLAIYGAGWLAFSRLDWIRKPGIGGYLLMLAAGLFIAIGVEWIAVHVIHRWTYAGQMPRVPGLDIGIVPIAQMLVLPPLIFRVASRFLRGRPDT